MIIGIAKTMQRGLSRAPGGMTTGFRDKRVLFSNQVFLFTANSRQSLEKKLLKRYF